jgi:apolipoprotein N-acyltransferase
LTGPAGLLSRAEAARLGLSALLLALAFPPLPFGLLALVALTPLLAVLDQDPRPGFRRGFLQGTFFGAVFYLVLLFWLWDLFRFTPLIAPTWLVSSVYLGTLVGLAVGVVQWLHARMGRSPALLLPCAWVALEKLLQFGDLRFTWGVLADALTPYPLLLQTAELWGALGLSFLVVCFNGLVFILWNARRQPRERRRAATALAALTVTVLGYGSIRWRALEDPPSAIESLRVAVIQPNIPQEARDDPRRAEFEKDRLFELSQQALVQAPDLVVWPETATSWLRYDPAYLEELIDLCCRRAQRAVPFLVGGLDAEPPPAPRSRFFNAAFLISAAGELVGVYRKALLVPMTEQVPYSRLLGFLKPERWSGSFSAGNAFAPLVLELGGRTVRIAVPICYEIIFPQAIREFRLRGARLIVTITNDAWFGRTPAPFQHFSQLQLRAVEHRMGIARSANTGISGFVTARGEVLAKTGIFEPGFLLEELPLAGSLTIYSRWGDWIVLAVWMALSLMLSLSRSGGSSGRDRPNVLEAPSSRRPASDLLEPLESVGKGSASLPSGKPLTTGARGIVR